MLENILELEGAQKLSKNEQKSVHGGRVRCGDPVFSHIEPPGEGAINGGQGGMVFKQVCRQYFLGMPLGKPFDHYFSPL